MMFSMQSGLGWPTPETECHVSNHGNHSQTVTADKHLLASAQSMFQTHSCSTSQEVKLLSFLISSKLGCKGLKALLPNNSLKSFNLPVTPSVYNKHRPFRLPFYCLSLGKKKKRNARVGTGLAAQSQSDYEGLGSKSFLCLIVIFQQRLFS